MELPIEKRALLLNAMRLAAREDILPRFRSLEASEVDQKTHVDDLVTVADRAAEWRVSEVIKAAWPEARIIGEEAISEGTATLDGLEDEDWAVVIDPIDGTWNFAKGLSAFGMILAVLHRGKTVWGVLYDPLLDDWIEPGTPPLFIRADGTKKEFTLATETDPSKMMLLLPLGLFTKCQQAKIAPIVPVFRRVNSLRCSCHEYRLLAQGHVDAVVGIDPNPWDHLTGTEIVKRGGGVARMLDGSDYTPEKVRGVLLTATSDTAWRNIAALLRPAIGP